MSNDEAIKYLVNATYSDDWQGNNDLQTALHLAISALVRDRWIPCEERLPERNKEALVYAIGNTDGFWGTYVIAIAQRFIFKLFPSSEGEEEWSSPWQYFHTDYKITHWKPLPEPPKEDKP